MVNDAPHTAIRLGESATSAGVFSSAGVPAVVLGPGGGGAATPGGGSRGREAVGRLEGQGGGARGGGGCKLDPGLKAPPAGFKF